MTKNLMDYFFGPRDIFRGKQCKAAYGEHSVHARQWRQQRRRRRRRRNKMETLRVGQTTSQQHRHHAIGLPYLAAVHYQLLQYIIRHIVASFAVTVSPGLPFPLLPSLPCC